LLRGSLLKESMETKDWDASAKIVREKSEKIKG